MTAGLSKVMAGWAGGVSVQVGAATATVSPSPRDSAAGVWRSLVRLAQRKHGGRWWASVGSDGKLTIGADVVFDLSASSTTQAALGLSGTYTGAQSYTAAAAHSGGLYPFLIDAVAPRLALRHGLPMADGSAAFAGPRLYGQGSVRIADTHENAVSHAAAIDDAAVWDVWCGGRIRGRVRIQDVAPLARVGRGTHLMLVEAQALEVTS